MDNVNYFRDLFESIPDYRKIVLLLYSIKNDDDLLKETGFNENHIDQLSLDFKNILFEEHENYFDFVKNEEETVIETILNK